MNYDIEKLDSLPYREGMLKRYPFQHELKKEYRKHRIPKKAFTILKNSVGRPLSSLQRRLKYILPSTFCFNTFIEWQTHIMYKDDNGFIRHFNYRGLRNIVKYYWVDENNILQYFTSNLPQKIKTKVNIKKSNYTSIKNRQKTISLTLIKLINNRPLFNFYINQVKELKDYENLKEQSERSSEGDLWKMYFIKMKEKKLRELNFKILEENIKQIELGNYKVFYESNEYLFSQNKECPHFEQVIKTKI